MKKIMATLLTVCLLLQLSTGFVIPVDSTKTAASTAKAAEVISEDSSVEIEVRSSLFSPCKGIVSVEINNGTKKQTKELEFLNNVSGIARFDNLKSGEYTITVLADRFEKYEQTITVKAGWLHRLLICSSKIDNTVSNATLGWIKAGDVNNDKLINEKDTNQVLSDIHHNVENTNSDINNDGKTDIADLQYLVQLESGTQKSVVERLRIVKNINKLYNTEFISGDIDSLIKNQPVTLRPSNPNEKISDTNPIGLEFILANENSKDYMIDGIPLCVPSDDGSSSDITNGVVEVEQADGKKFEISLNQTNTANLRQSKKSLKTAPRDGATVSTESDGSLVLNFNGQIAVKRVTIKITGTKKTQPLLEIAKAEFVNNMEDRIPAPKLDIPALSSPKPENKQLDVSWSAQNNVTGYELNVSGPVKGSQQPVSEIINVSSNNYSIKMIKNASLINFKEYKIKVRSVNGDWHSPWSAEVIGIPAPQEKPAPPDNVSVIGGYESIRVSWKDMDDSNCYMVYYKKSNEPDSSYRPVVEGFTPTNKTDNCITTNNYTIENLEAETEYIVYVIGWNELGWSNPSLESLGMTKSSNPPELPNYKLINTSNGEGKVSAHIESATIGGANGAKMVGSSLDTEAKSGLGLVDNDYSSYWSIFEWDDGVSYPGNNKGMFITLDNDYDMNYITFAAFKEVVSLNQVRIEYWNTATGSDINSRKVVGASLVKRQDKHKNPYYIIKFNEKVTANKVHISLSTGYTRAEMKVGEIRFYNYDKIEDDIMALYADDMHTTLKSDVTAETISLLEQRLETPDAASGEKHPFYEELKLEIDNIKNIFNDNPSPSYEVINQITSKKDNHLGFGGLNSWQPLGKTVYAGEKLVVYVGHNQKKTNQSTDLTLVMTQYHSESNKLSKTSAALKTGRNIITVPQIADKNFERGGQIYIAYSGNNSSDRYAVRILGGSDIPVLNLYGKTDTERKSAIEIYIGRLEEHLKNIQKEHEKHRNVDKALDYKYDEKNCILNATDIMMESMMYSLPATQVLNPLLNKADKVNALNTSLKAMEDAMTLFYHHKGLSNDAKAAEKGNNALPSQHLNIRYMRMFAGAFMYASGNHIGIEYGSSNIASGATSINSLGWGIAHEIGHDINQGSYAVAEVTNNYFSQLLTGKERYTWENVYKKVTSGMIGRASNVFTQLALYWQLHLAFDNEKNDHRIYDNYKDQFNNLFFARVDTYSRNPAKAPQEGLLLNGGTDQNIMRLSCAAANKNILPFFERWGMIPDKATAEYAKKYGEAETKALYYVNPSARDYRVANPSEKSTILNKENIVIAKTDASSNQVKVHITANAGVDKNLILGYEIIRSMTSNGKKESQVVGFQPIATDSDITTFTDTISTINNRVMSYTVKAVDKYLNYSKEVDAGAVKIQTDGVIDKSLWTVETTTTSTEDTQIKTNDDDPDNGYDTDNATVKKVHTIDRIIDNNKTTVYNGRASSTGAEITIDMHKTQAVTALKYNGAALSSVNIQVSEDGTKWTTVKEKVNLEGTDESKNTIWFNSVQEAARDNWIGTYDARYIKLTTSQTGNISINEIDICGPSGDNLEFITTDGTKPAIGKLSEDYKYGDKEKDVIPAGSLIFTGTYKGNSAYNIVILYDTDGNVIGGTDSEGNLVAKQVIFADVPEKGNLGETSDGTWVYYIEPKDLKENYLKTLKGIRGELYRVDNAKTAEGERITSDTLVITDIPQTLANLPDITLTGSIIQGGNNEKVN